MTDKPAKKPTLKRFPCSGTLADAISTFYFTCAELRDEAREVFDGMPESLQGGSRGEAFDQTANTLEEFCDDEPEYPAEAEDLPCTWIENRRKGPSRATRRDNAVAAADGAIEALEGRIASLEEDIESADEGDSTEADEQLKSDLEELLETLQTAKDQAGECEFPGMYG